MSQIPHPRMDKETVMFKCVLWAIYLVIAGYLVGTVAIDCVLVLSSFKSGASIGLLIFDAAVALFGAPLMFLGVFASAVPDNTHAGFSLASVVAFLVYAIAAPMIGLVAFDGCSTDCSVAVLKVCLYGVPMAACLIVAGVMAIDRLVRCFPMAEIDHICLYACTCHDYEVVV